jgi:hypothetical protein
MAATQADAWPKTVAASGTFHLPLEGALEGPWRGDPVLRAGRG